MQEIRTRNSWTRLRQTQVPYCLCADNLAILKTRGVKQIKRRRRLLEMLARDMKIAQGGAQAAMPHQTLDGMKIDSSLMEQASMTCQLRFNQAFLETMIERLAQTSDELAQRMD